jgi:hypothetical protein
LGCSCRHCGIRPTRGASYAEDLPPPRRLTPREGQMAGAMVASIVIAGAAHEVRGGGGVISLPQFGPTAAPSLTGYAARTRPGTAPLPLTSASSNSAAAIARSRAARSSLAVSSVSSIPGRAPGSRAMLMKSSVMNSRRNQCALTKPSTFSLNTSGCSQAMAWPESDTVVHS